MKSKSAYRIMAVIFVVVLILVAVSAVVINININKTPVSDIAVNMGVGQVYQLPEESARHRLRGYDREIITVDKNGAITAVSKGSTRISSGRKKIDVNVFDAPKSVSLDDGAFALGVGEEYQLSPYVPDSEFNAGFTYTPSEEGIVSIDENGKLTAVMAGKTTVTVSTYNNCTASCDVTVGNPPEEISLSATSKTLFLGASGRIFINIPADCASMETVLQSSDENIVKVTPQCELIPVAVGTATITATTYNGVSASCEISVAEKPQCIRSGLDPRKPMIAFTFDDGPNEETTNRILDVFEKNNASCTFFIVGNRTNRGPNEQCVKRMVEKGFQLGNHTYDHKHYGAKVTIEDITKCTDRLNEISGIGPSAFRPTGGEMSDLIKQNCGAPIILWSIDTEDWKNRDSAKIYSNVLRDARDGGIVLMHDIYKSTADAVEAVIPKLIENGYQVVNVAELAYYKGKNLENGTVYYSIK